MKHVLFDVDGVLVHPWRFRQHLIDHYGITPDVTRPFFEGPFLDCVLGNADLYEELAPFLGTWGWTESLDALIDLWFHVEDAPNHEVLAFAGELRAAGTPCHVASNQERHRARFLAEDMGLQDHFDRLFFSSQLGAAKPDPEYFRRIAAELEQPTTNVILLDDNPAYLAGAQSAGVEPIHFEDLKSLERVRTSLALPTPPES